MSDFDEYEWAQDYERRMKRESRWMLAGLIVCVVFAGTVIYFTDVITR